MTAGDPEEGRPGARLHHTHLMASDLDATIGFWTACFGADVVADETMAGARNVLLDVGGGRLNLYDQAPNHRGPVNHVGVQVEDLATTVARLTAAGWIPGPLRASGPLTYAMVEGPDRLLVEVFHFDRVTTPRHLRSYFDLAPDRQPATGQLADRPVGLGSGALSAEAEARLAKADPAPLRPPPSDDLEAVGRWRRSIHRSWLDGDPSAAACGHDEVVLGGVRCLRAVPEHGADPPFVLYLHGGGHALGSPEVALPITTALARTCEVVSVDYRLAPEHPFPAALDDARAVERALGDGRPDRPLILAGDSAGAGLALALAVAGRDVGRRPASGLALLSPHLDHDGPGRSRARLSDVDRVAAEWLRAAYVGRHSPADPLISPLRAPLTGLPPILVQVGESDPALPDAVRLARAARLAGVPVTLDVWAGMWHTWHYHRDLPEAANALAEVAGFAADHGSGRQLEAEPGAE